MLQPFTLVNGQEQDAIPVTDRGLAYGDGLFETVLLRDGELVLWERHKARLIEGCRRLLLPFAIEDLDDDLSHLMIVNKGVTTSGVVKIIITRGSGGRGYAPPAQPQSTRIVALHQLPEYPKSNVEEGVIVRLCKTPLSRNKLTAGMKHLNRLEQVLAKAELAETDIDEGLMSDEHGNVIEGTMSNLFLVLDGNLITPSLAFSGVAGVMREEIKAMSERMSLTFIEKEVDLNLLEQAQEVFVCNSVVGLWPVKELQVALDSESKSYRSIFLKKGSVTERLQDDLSWC